MNETTSVICERAFEFASRILKLCTRLHERGVAGRHVANQLIKWGTSFGANAEESQEGQSKPDFYCQTQRLSQRSARKQLLTPVGGKERTRNRK
jgi:four helix bundle protein